MFHLRLEGGLVTARQSGRLLALLLVDLDRFKAVNDTLGHATGDMVLRTTAERMLGAVREGDTVARLGGDEFAVVLPELERAGDARTMAERLARSLNESMAAAGETISVGASIGIALFPADGPDAEELLRYADAAMYRAKRGREWPPIAAVPARDAMQAPVPSSPPAPPAA
ncbi:MAG: GGDEF domain-containing protein [Chloroflexi bacterium]|nr:GGDEF domain-containing protein [Chloroflexota bacterium]